MAKPPVLPAQPNPQPEQAGGGIVPTLAELVALRAVAAARRAPRQGRLAGAGRAPSPLRGRGMEYAESREYAPGDEVRHIDWRVTARSGRAHTKVFQAERERLTLLVASDAGYLVNTSSVNGFWATLAPGVPHTAYSAAKFAVKGLSEALLEDFRVNAPHVKVAVVMPGHIGTDIVINSRKVHARNEPGVTEESEVELIRTGMAKRGLPTDGMTDEQLLQMVEMFGEMFRDNAPMTAAQAATVILDGVRAGRWRILVGEDARALDEAVMSSRHEDITLEVAGAEQLSLTMDSISAEAACTSTQLHLQVAPERYASYWNAAQLLAGPQLAVGANSPYLFGRQLHAETRIEVFAQSTDARSPELRNQGVRPRVFFGDRWITSIFDLFEENVRYFPALLPITSDEDPAAVLAAGGTPALDELRLHNGTIYRWNRPVYDVQDGRPHLRVENRVLPAGPTVVDTLANAAFFYGAVVDLVTDDRPLWSRMSFNSARENFTAGARDGIEARFYWPEQGEVDAHVLVRDTLLPMAARGLARLGVDPAIAERYLSIIEARARLRRNGATWQVAATKSFEAAGASRSEALRAMTRAYVLHGHGGDPVHTWPLP